MNTIAFLSPSLFIGVRYTCCLKNKFITKAFLFFYLMKIGILGSGDVGRRLADGFIELGHTVKIGSRDPNQSKVTEWIDKHNKGNLLTQRRLARELLR